MNDENEKTFDESFADNDDIISCDKKEGELNNVEDDFRHYVVLPLRDIVIFPKMVTPLFIGRSKSVEALNRVVEKEEKILLVTQKDSTVNEPKVDELYKVGTLASIVQLLKMPDGTLKILVEGEERIKIEELSITKDIYLAKGKIVKEEPVKQDMEQPLRRTLMASFENYVKGNKKQRAEILSNMSQMTDLGQLVDSIAVQMEVSVTQKQDILEIFSLSKRINKLSVMLENEISILEVEKRIRSRVKKQMEKNQREYYLNEQVKAIQKELGESEDGVDEISQFEKKIRDNKLSKEASNKAMQELGKLKMMSPMSAEATVLRNYLEWITSVPWSKKSRPNSDLTKAAQILDRDHYGLEKVKERVLEYLAVQKRANKVKGSIICLVGPPGVGKTSLGRSLAEASGREFVRLALGGVRDESEIRGHRRTYIGSMPGKIISSMKKAKTINPLFLLDEIDKLGVDFRGDPSSALLEVLDPNQNDTFNDHYLEVDYDLSNVMFIATANTLNIPEPLKDRMEIIRIAGYTEEEKIRIVRQRVLAKQLEANHLNEDEFQITDNVIRDLIRYYTREAGVRNLEREIANLCRKVVLKIAKGKEKIKKVKIISKQLQRYAGVRKYNFGEAEKKEHVGVVTGLAWTEVGGDLLTVEALMMNGKGKMVVTGNLRDVMKESISAANSYVKANANFFGIDAKIFEDKDIHVHVPEGATPKDGPSAGVAMVTTIVSVLTEIPIRNDIAMTGEITLRGRILGIGGLKEKLLAALRGGVKKVFIPKDNVKDLAEIPNNVKNGLEIVPIESISEVVMQALVRQPKPLDIKDSTYESKKLIAKQKDIGGDLISH